ncbi:hypothetical protein [Acinetobacter sp. TAC-1]|uniref:hypothetical protein n=1 Tax=Acinetobacter sp. TAC-1 TaxID=3027470 RepID=UPI0023AA3CFA|nr:hypothetical protein [Acinetobacter sp. TAC-1]WEE41023.1 hypothetical protein PYV58_07650 [Acinetobacter sp. TAC-1]
MKKDPIELAVYIVTGLFLAYLIYICFIAEPDQLLFGNVFIKTDPIDFGGFGSLLAGIFSPLAFLWLILNFKLQAKGLKVSQDQLQLLLDERDNKRKALRVIFDNPKCSVSKISQIHPTDENSIFFDIKLIAPCDLMQVHLSELNELSKFNFSYRLNKNSTTLSTSKKDIKNQSNMLIKIRFDKTKLPIEGYLELEDKIKINYLDSEGYPQFSEFNIYIIINLNKPIDSLIAARQLFSYV